MQTFRVDDMTCGHCAAAITRAIQATDKDAKITVDLARRLVMVEPAEADPRELGGAITEAGYTPALLAATTIIAKPAKAGSCCGCCG